jgi:phage/plasmid-associated DNA primase
LYQAYCAWARKNGHSVLNNAQFGKELSRAFKNVKRSRPTMPDGTRQWVYQGIALSTSDVVEEVAA